MAHTPTPWRVEENTDLIWGACNADDTSSYGMGYPIVSGFASFGTWAAGRPDFNEKEANAAFIVRAVNAHDELIEALLAIDALWTESHPAGPAGDRRFVGGFGELSDDTIQVWTKIRAALAKHGGAA